MSGNDQGDKYVGIAAAPGYAVGPIFIWQERGLDLPEPYSIDDPERAWEEIEKAISQVKSDIEEMRDRAAGEVGEKEAAIFDAHASIIEDVALRDRVQKKLDEGVNPEAAWQESYQSFAQKLEELPDTTLSARAADIRDVGEQVLAVLLGYSTTAQKLESPAIIIARDLTPSQTIKMERDKVLAFCTAEGGKTSHTAILANALGIPAVVAMGEEVLDITEGIMGAVDGEDGFLAINPSQRKLNAIERKKVQSRHQFEEDLKQADQPAITTDGMEVEVAANIGKSIEAAQAVKFGAEGVGLFRTEFLYLDRETAPSIEEQVAAYREVIDALKGRFMVVRTLDVGGDKQLPYLDIQEEPNPFLGWRAIRMIDKRPDVLEDQFYALLLAGEGTDLRIMIPLVSRVSEVIEARKLLDNALKRARENKPGFDTQLQFGIMVEVPSAALMVDHFAPHVDFFSIGTNDLTQYTLAVDRMNQRVASLASPYSPAVLKLVDRTIRRAHRHDKWVGLCGELAGDPLAAPILLGMGLDEFSMSPRSIPRIKAIIRELSVAECKKVADHVLTLESAEQVRSYVKDQFDF